MSSPHQPLFPLIIQRTAYSFATLIQHVGIDHGGAHIFVSQKFLNAADVTAILRPSRLFDYIQNRYPSLEGEDTPSVSGRTRTASRTRSSGFGLTISPSFL